MDQGNNAAIVQAVPPPPSPTNMRRKRSCVYNRNCMSLSSVLGRSLAELMGRKNANLRLHVRKDWQVGKEGRKL